MTRAFSAPKREDTPNEDRWSRSGDSRVFVVSDGASVSFDSALWAEILCRRFVSDPSPSREWFEAALEEYSSQYGREAMAWMQQAALDKGSFATILGVTLSKDLSTANIFGIGDSILAVIDDGKVVRVLPNMQPSDFDLAPQLVSTNPNENSFLTDEFISRAWQRIDLKAQERPTLLLMTDALGRWLIEQPEKDRVAALMDLQTDDEFAKMVELERAEGRLKRDDTTLIVIGD
jgi:hypothetical protein